MKSISTGLALNEHGTVVSTHMCLVCEKPFTVCPPFEGEDHGGCLDVTCESYDAARDVDRCFEPGG